MPVKHKFTSLKADGNDLSVVRPSNWNADHDFKTAGASVYLGRNAAAGSGDVQELPIDPETVDDFTMWTKAAVQAAIAAAIAPFVEGVRTNVASAAAIDIGAVATHYVNITGTTGINSLGTANSGVWRRLIFAGALILADNANILLPGTGAITTEAGDTATFVSNGLNVWVCFAYQRATGLPLIVPPGVRVNGGYVENTSNTTLTANIAIAGNVIPQISQGTEVLTFTITPKKATNRVRVRVKVPLGAVAGQQGVACVALFRNGGTNAIATGYPRLTDGFGTYAGLIDFEDSPGAITTQVYSVRAGGATFSVTLNGDVNGQLGGGTMRATLTLDEYSS